MAAETRLSWHTRLASKFGITIPEWRTVLIWAAGFALMTALTTKDFLALLHEYRHNNVGTQVEVVVIDENYKPPQVTFKIPIYKLENRYSDPLMEIARHLHNGTFEACDICQGLVDRNITDYCSLGLDPCYYAVSLTLTEKIFDKIDQNHSSFFNETGIFSDELVHSAAVNFIILHSSADYDFVESSELSGIGLLHDRAVPDSKWKLGALSDQIMLGLCRDITYEEFYMKNEFSAPQRVNGSCESLLLDPSNAVSLDYEGLWIPLPPSNVPKLKEFKFKITEHGRNSLWKPATEDVLPKPVSMYPDIGIQYAASIDSVFATYMYRSTLKRGREALNITVRYGVQMRARDNRTHDSSCYNRTSATVCFTMCTKDFIIDKCGCVPFSTRKGLVYDEQLPYCTWQSYELCNVTEMPDDKQQLCLDKCNSGCEYTSYMWHVDDSSHKPPKNTREIIIQTIPMFNTFAQLLQTTKNTPEQFLSQVGGIVNFFLGFSGLTIIACILFFIDCFKRLKRDGTKEMSPVEQGQNGLSMTATRYTDWTAQIPRRSEGDLRREFEQFRTETKAELAMIRNAVKLICQKLEI